MDTFCCCGQIRVRRGSKQGEDSAVDTRGGAKQPITLSDPALQQDLPVQCLLLPEGVLLLTWVTQTSYGKRS